MSAPTTPAYSLVDHHGRPVTERSYRGRWQLVFFGFTHCGAVCPRALRRLSATLDDLAEPTGTISPLYITVDPDRDTPTVMREFLREYPHFTGLTGSAEAIEAVKAAFRVFARREDDSAAPDGYSVPHTAITYLVSPAGEYKAHFSDAMPQKELVARLRAHLDR
ncbi:SCO family protein [Amycolatopsis sp. H20-H5]|uniref:SCO family protein n=1 Tax=Amycolatopsis sp. H20-H5 TaxID=3046309 RepID=UPI002DBC95BB|nr:SCO family protein [Amycolatopsis sp. H20-H5]MEC3982661.1 SCO family protein [Amycolatopsis sp. H20-H5]